MTLRCGGCGEHVLLLGRAEGWYEAPRGSFRCGCGRGLSLGARVVPDEAGRGGASR